MRSFLSVAALASAANAYFLIGLNPITTERIDPIVNPGQVAGHAHIAFGGSNFRINTNTASLRQSECTSVGIKEDRSAYWYPELYFHWKNGSFTSVKGGSVTYYLFSDTAGVTTPFPTDFRMISGDMLLRTYDPNSFAQQAVTFLCLDFQGVSKRYNELPPTRCPNGIRSQINFPSCWDGQNADSPNHKSHVAFLSEGPDRGTCNDPKYPKTLPRIFSEIYWGSQDFDADRQLAMNPDQPFVFSNGDPTGYGYHGDFFNGWTEGTLQKVVDGCNCNPSGSPDCCAEKGLFTLNKETNCKITKTWDEQITGTLPKLPGNNPVQPFGTRASALPNDFIPARIDPVFAYIGDTPPATGTPVGTGQVLAGPGPTNTPPPPPPPPVTSSPPPVTSSPPPVSSSPPPPAPPPPSQSGSTSTPTPTSSGDPGFCDASGQYRRHQKRNYRRSLHNAEFGEAL